MKEGISLGGLAPAMGEWCLFELKGVEHSREAVVFCLTVCFCHAFFFKSSPPPSFHEMQATVDLPLWESGQHPET